MTTGLVVTELPAEQAEELLVAIASQLTTLRNEMSQFPITYYFHTGERVTSLSGILPYVRALADRASAADRPDGVRLSGTMLRIALHNYLEFIGESFLRIKPSDDNETIRRYAADQRRPLIDIVEQPGRRAA
jgi:hypothetical protein